MSTVSTETAVSQPDWTVPLLTAKEVAARARVSSRTVRRWGDAGVLERIDVGPRLSRYTAESVAALLTPHNDDGTPRQAPRVTTEEGTHDARHRKA